MTSTLEDRVKDVMSSVFDIPKKNIEENASPDNIESWDSLKQMNLMIALEEEFEIGFKDEDIIEMINYKLIVNILKNSPYNFK